MEHGYFHPWHRRRGIDHPDHQEREAAPKMQTRADADELIANAPK